MNKIIVDGNSFPGWVIIDTDLDISILDLIIEYPLVKDFYNDFKYIVNQKYIQEKELLNFSREPKKIEIIKIYKHKWRNVLFMPKATFFTIGSVLVSLLTSFYKLEVDFRYSFFNRIEPLKFKEDKQLRPFQQKIIDTVLNTKQVDVTIRYLKSLWNTWEDIFYPSVLKLNYEQIRREIIKNFPIFNEKVFGWFVISPARSGKTVTMAYLANQLWLRTLIIVDLWIIFKQFQEVYDNFFYTQKWDVLFYKWEKSFKWWILKNKVWVAMIQTLYNLTTTPKWKDILKKELSQYDLVIVDEAHSSATRQFIQTFEHLNFKQIFGFTATKYRKDGNIELLDRYIWPTLVKVSQNEVKSLVKDIIIYPYVINHW